MGAVEDGSTDRHAPRRDARTRERGNGNWVTRGGLDGSEVWPSYIIQCFPVQAPLAAPA